MEPITAEEFSATPGLEDWRVHGWHAFAIYRTSDFVTAQALLDDVGRLAEAAGHHPDLNLRWGRLEVRVGTHSERALTTADRDLCVLISTAATQHGLSADVDAVADSEVLATADGA